MNILNRHLYRTSKAKDQDKPAITIPFSSLQRIIDAHEKQQSYLDINRGIRKRPHDELKDDRDEEEVFREIEHTKRPHVEDT